MALVVAGCGHTSLPVFALLFIRICIIMNPIQTTGSTHIDNKWTTLMSIYKMYLHATPEVRESTHHCWQC